MKRTILLVLTSMLINTLTACGAGNSPINRTFGPADLPNLVLQPNEVSLPLVNSISLKQFEELGAGIPPDYIDQFRSCNMQAGEVRGYSNLQNSGASVQDAIVGSRAIVFDSSENASKFFQLWSKLSKIPPDKNTKVLIIDATGLGDENTGFSYNADNSLYNYNYIWRVNNVFLNVSYFSGQPLKETDARSLANKMQSHVK